VVLIRITGIR